MRVEPSAPAALAQRAVEGGPGRGIHGPPAAFLDLRGSAEPAVGAPSRKRPGPGCCAPHARDGQQPAEGTGGLGPSRAGRATAPGRDEAWLEVVLPQDGGRGALPVPTAAACWWPLVPWILGVHEARQASHRWPPVLALGGRRAQGRPRDHGTRDARGRPTPARKAGELAESACEGEPRHAGRTTESESGVHRVQQHPGPSGHGRATAGRSGRATWAAWAVVSTAAWRSPMPIDGSAPPCRRSGVGALPGRGAAHGRPAGGGLSDSGACVARSRSATRAPGASAAGGGPRRRRARRRPPGGTAGGWHAGCCRPHSASPQAHQYRAIAPPRHRPRAVLSVRAVRARRDPAPRSALSAHRRPAPVPPLRGGETAAQPPTAPGPAWARHGRGPACTGQGR
jgi:hypothetical protein